ncbi:MAG: flagellar hook-length control protein FliK [Dehalococcoidia bacterium]|nr:flagellar hook-length control protein FliK [Dehalococcoidia bacterium]
MTAVIAPGIPVMGPAPSATNGSPGGTPADAGAPGPFAALLAAVTAAKGTGGETPASPPGDATAAQVLDIDALMALLAEFNPAAAEDGPMPEPATLEPDMPLLDRPAGVEAEPTGTEPGTALETLMAALLLVRPEPTPPVEHSLPGGDLVPPAANTLVGAAGVTQEQNAEGVPTTSMLLTDEAGVPAATQSSSVAVTAEAMTASQTAAAVGAAVGLDEGEPSDVTATVATLGDSSESVMTPVAQPTTEAQAETPEARAEHASGIAQQESDGADVEVEVVTAEPLRAATTGTSNDGRQVAAMTPASAPVETVMRPEPAVRTVSAANPVPDLADSVRGAVVNGDTEVRLRLDPPEMGSLEIHIARQDGAIRIRVEATLASARDVIEQALPALQQALEARDMRVDRLEIRTMSESASGRSMTEQGGQPGGGRQPQQDGAPEWSPVAAIDGVRRDAPARDGRASDGRLDVMA